jgi:hypothetical protein
MMGGKMLDHPKLFICDLHDDDFSFFGEHILDPTYMDSCIFGTGAMTYID